MEQDDNLGCQSLENLVVEWRLIDDNEESRRILGATLGQKSFSGFWLYLLATRQVTWWVGKFLALPIARSTA
jgi:hypothetical protein